MYIFPLRQSTTETRWSPTLPTMNIPHFGNSPGHLLEKNTAGSSGQCGERILRGWPGPTCGNYRMKWPNTRLFLRCPAGRRRWPATSRSVQTMGQTRSASKPFSTAWSRSQLQIRCLGYLNDLKFVIFCHSEYVCRSFFKTRNSRTSKFHVVFLFPREFSGVRFTFRIAKHVTFIHFNLLSTRISCTHIMSNKKVHLYVNENWQGHAYNLKLTADRKYSPFQMTTLKFLPNGWQDGEQEKGNL